MKAVYPEPKPAILQGIGQDFLLSGTPHSTTPSNRLLKNGVFRQPVCGIGKYRHFQWL